MKIRAVTIHQSLFTAAVLVFTSLYSATDYPTLTAAICGLLVLGFGLPHGALDHILFYAAYDNLNRMSRPEQSISAESGISKSKPDPGVFGSIANTAIVFYCNYLSMMSMWAFFWYLYPWTSFWAFIAVSCWHFGEGDLGYLQGISSHFKPILYLSRGGLIIGLTMTSQPEITLPIIQHLIQMPRDFFFSLSNRVPLVVCAFHFLALWRLWCLAIFQSPPSIKGKENADKDGWQSNTFPSHKACISYDTVIIETLKSILFTSLFSTLNPLLAFSVYFGIWHGYGCIYDFISWLKQNDWAGFTEPSHEPINQRSSTVSLADFARFYTLAAPYTLVSVAGMAGLYAGWAVLIQDSSSWEHVDGSLVWAVFIGCISVLTGGHVWVVVGLYWPKFWDADPLGIF